jgi:hypothetical protein
VQQLGHLIQHNKKIFTPRWNFSNFALATYYFRNNCGFHILPNTHIGLRRLEMINL